MPAIYQPFVERIARVTVQVTRNNSRGEPTNFTYVYEQHRMRIQVRQGGQQFGNAHIEIFGAKLADMNQIARLWLESMTPQNTDTVAIDVWDGKTFVPFFQGVITWSAVDASGIPHVKLVVDANAAMPLMNTPVSPYANPGPVILSDVLISLAQQAGFSVDYAASAPVYSLSDIRLTGSPLQQIGALMRHFPDLTWFVNLQRVVVRQANAPFEADAIRVAVDTGMQFAPVYSTSGLQISTIFNPRIRPGVALDVQTDFDFVNRTQWVAAVLAHALEPNVPGGQWTTSLAANSFGSKNNT
jgi:hypothetical protein